MSVSVHSSASDGDREIPGGVYVVGFFDMLGQSNVLTPYIDVRAEPQYIEELRREMTRVIKQLSAFRNDVTTFFHAASATTLTDNPPVGVTAEQLGIAADFQSSGIRIQGFSDTLVVYVPLSTLKGQLSLYGIWSLMISVANTMFLSFARGFAVRGGIDVSWGAEPFDGEFYGPALLSAYKLESQVANWSRIVLGPGIQRLWKLTRDGAVESPIDRANKTLAQIQSSWAFNDVDETMAVDYLGSSMLNALTLSDVDLPAVIDAAHVGLERLFGDASGRGRPQEIIGGAINYFETRLGPLTEQRRSRAASIRGGR